MEIFCPRNARKFSALSMHSSFTKHTYNLMDKLILKIIHKSQFMIQDLFSKIIPEIIVEKHQVLLKITEGEIILNSLYIFNENSP